MNRIMRDIKDFFQQDIPLFTYHRMDFDDGNRNVFIEMNGPEDSAFQGGKFMLKFDLPHDFPYSPPSIICQTPLWHPNVSEAGSVCMDLLDVKWDAGTTLIELAEAVRSLLINPNPHSPLNCDASSLLRHHPEMYNDNAALWTNNLAGGSATTSLQESLDILTEQGQIRPARLSEHHAGFG